MTNADRFIAERVREVIETIIKGGSPKTAEEIVNEVNKEHKPIKINLE
jgi:DNA polymerase elongation subunit (family B)